MSKRHLTVLALAWIMLPFGDNFGHLMACFAELRDDVKITSKIVTMNNFNVVSPLRYALIVPRYVPLPKVCPQESDATWRTE